MTSKDVEKMARDAIRFIGADGMDVVWHPDNPIGDNDPRCAGYVQVDYSVDICPQLVGDEVGWGVSYIACTPGVRTLPNGDPGWPDDYDVVDVATAAVEVASITGKRTHARPAHDAVRRAIDFLVGERLKAWNYADREEAAI